MRYLITGVAGFIGSTLAEDLLADGHEVVGVDSFTEYYAPERKRANLALCLNNPRFRLVEADLRTAPLAALLDGVTTVFHEAGEPGVRGSWRDGFATYVGRNIEATQRLLETLREHPQTTLVYASSSSVYGKSENWPCVESQTPSPYSPYGVTKLAAEHLVLAYAGNFDLRAIALRYFTVYGPRQRPDMLMHRLCEAAIAGNDVTIFGDGRQIRDFTHVKDVVRANRLAADRMPLSGALVLNVCGGTSASISDVIDILEQHAGHRIPRTSGAAQSGDVPRTGGSSEAARAALGWQPNVSLSEGLLDQLNWHHDKQSGLEA